MSRYPARDAVILALGLLVSVAGPGAPSEAQETLTITSWGGSSQDAQRKAYFEAFTKETGVVIKENVWSGELAKLEAMVKSGNVTWDVLSAGTTHIDQICESGLVERINIGMFGKKEDFVDGADRPCGVQSTFTGQVLGFKPARFADGGPVRLADFFDLNKYPGKRGMRRGPQQQLEAALLADGVTPAQLYQVLGTEAGLARAFKKLDSIKEQVVWFQSYSEAENLILSDEVVMAFGPHLKLSAHPTIKTLFDGISIGGEVWTIPKGTPKKDLAIRFIQFANRESPQIVYTQSIKSGVALKSVMGKLPPDYARQLVTFPENFAKGYVFSARFWADHQEDYQARFTNWLAKK
jgi:putative spermidine/putrescine transport system substrate-binding protein